MKMLQRRIGCMVLATLFLAGCGESAVNTMETVKTGENGMTDASAPGTVAEIEEETEYDIFSVLPENDFGGSDFIVFVPTNPTVPVDMGLTADELDGTTFNDAVYNRNAALDDRYNVKISSYQGGWFGATYDALYPNVMAGDNVYDVYLTHIYNRNPLILTGHLCMRWDDLPYIQMDMPWWNQSAIKNLNLANKSIFAVSSATIPDIMCLLFNKEIAEANTDFLGDLYSYVDNNTWTMDKLKELTEHMSLDLNGDGEMKAGDDQFGLVISKGWQLVSLQYACDVITINLDEEGFPHLQMEDERVYNVFDKLYTLMHSEGIHTFTGELPDVGMETGRAFMVEYNLFSIHLLRDGDVDYGILPYPKFDEMQEKYTNNSWCGMMCLPITTPEDHYEMIGTLMEALSFTGYKEITPLYYDNVLKAKLSRDVESARMLDIIVQSTVYDLGQNIEQNIHPATMMSNLIASDNPNFMSQLQKTKNVMIKQYEKLYDKVLALD